jgi:hypothetical protein
VVAANIVEYNSNDVFGDLNYDPLSP